MRRFQKILFALGLTLIGNLGSACLAQTNITHFSFDSAHSGIIENESKSYGRSFGQYSSTSNAGILDGSRQSTFTSFFGVDGSKQPQDFGANANFGLAAQLNYSAPLISDYGMGFQMGTRAVFSGNAVQVFELLGESKDRFQSFTTVGVFQRLDSGFSYGFVYDFLSQDSFDRFTLGQWRLRASYDLTDNDEIGVTFNFADRNDVGSFNSENVVLDPIDQFHIYLRHRWESGVNTSLWIGVGDEHSEENAVTGTRPPKSNQLLFGAEIFAPLNNWMAIYGETNLIMPADTGAIDAYLGVQITPQGIHRSRSRENRFRSFLPVAASPSFTTDLNRR